MARQFSAPSCMFHIGLKFDNRKLQLGGRLSNCNEFPNYFFAEAVLFVDGYCKCFQSNSDWG